MNMGDRIKELRIEKGLTQEELGKILGVKKAAIQKYESGSVKNIKRTKIKLLADTFGVSPSYILGFEDEIIIPNIDLSNYPNIFPIKQTERIPVIGHIAAGEPIYIDEELEYFVANDTKMNADFALKVQGDSMINARITDGDIVFIKTQPDVEDGEIAAILIDGEATLKRVYKMHGRVQLRAENPKYAPRDFTVGNCDSFVILGKAVGFQSNL